MTTTATNLSAVDRIEAIVRQIHSDTQTLIQAISAQTQAIADLTKTVDEMFAALGGSDQPEIDADTAALETAATDLAQTVGRDQPPPFQGA